METVANFIHGECVTGSGQRVQAIFNPATGEQIRQVVMSTTQETEQAIAAAMGRQIRVLTPLIEFGKADVVRLATEKGVVGTYSCHTGNNQSCGRCIACLEFQFNEGE